MGRAHPEPGNSKSGGPLTPNLFKEAPTKPILAYGVVGG